jgi:conjugal transfer pilus assembly protein TraE
MEYSAKQRQSKVVASIFVGLLVFLSLSMTGTIILGLENRDLRLNQPRHLIPMMLDKPFSISTTGADSNYLQMLGMSFILLRLNVSPETIDGQHKALLSYVDEESRPNLAAVLYDEARKIKSNEIASAFYSTNIAIDASRGTMDIRGVIRYFSGERPLTPSNKHYQLEFTFNNGVASLKHFLEVTDEKK